MRSLQCTRALAAGLVVYFHISLQIEHVLSGSGSSAAALFPSSGKAGVDVFFVLSGLLIWCSTQERREPPHRFFAKRLMRILPLYWSITLLVAAAALLIPSALRSTRFETSHLLASLVFLPWPNPASNGSPQDLMTPVIVPGWTLNFEMFFYLVFGLCLLAPLRIRYFVTIAAFGGVAAAFAAWRGDSPIIDFYDPGLILEFLLGLSLGYALEAGVLLPVPVSIVTVPIATALLIVLDASGIDLHRLILSGLPAAALIFGLASLDTRGLWPRLPWLVAVGDATYSIYLTHVIVLAGARIGVEALQVTLESAVAQVVFMLLLLGSSVALGLLTYRFVERPIGRALRRIGALASQPRPHVALADSGQHR